MPPSDFPKWQRVYSYFQKWSHDGTIAEIHEVLRKRLRRKRGLEVSPSVDIIDSQIVKVTKISGEYCGIDRGKESESASNPGKPINGSLDNAPKA